MKIEAVIFDWAGTTVDFGCFAPVQSFLNAFQAVNIFPTLDEIRAPMGMLKRDHVKTMLQMDRIKKQWIDKNNQECTETDIDSLYQKSEQEILNVVENFSSPKPFVLETVEKLRQMNIKIGSTTGYTDEMMAIVIKKAEALGYKPDAWFSPNSVHNLGRPYPFMIFKNMEALKVSSVKNVIKVGDTVSDIKEAINAGVIAVAVVDGSSEMGLSEPEFNSLSVDERLAIRGKVAEKFKAAGAEYVIEDIRGVIDLVNKLQNEINM